MANETKTRGTQLIRTDDSVPGVVKFYDRRQADVQKAFIAQIDVRAMAPGVEIPAPVLRLACHGATQNVLDTSNKLDGQARVDHIKAQCAIVQRGGWASAPVDEAKKRENAITALMGVGYDRAAAEKIVDKK